MARLARWVRDGWLMLGVTLLLLLSVELCYRTQASARQAIGSLHGVPRIKAPYADSTWFPAYLAEYERTFQLRWQPYVYFRRPAFTGSFINVDSSGHRRTQPGPRQVADTVRVFFFGGSTMWGSYLRDENTIASVAARELARRAPPDVTFAVTNFAESGYVSTQGMLELELQLRAGNVPDVVVFYDGINDVAAAVQGGVPGIPQNEFNRAREFDFGRAIHGTETGVGSDWRAMRAIGTAVAQRLQFVQRLAVAVRPAQLPPMSATLAARVARTYSGNVAIIEALARAHRFTALYVWQPALQTTTKRPTPFERLMLDENGGSEFQRRLTEVHRQLVPLLDSAIVSRVGGRFINETALFAGDTMSVFTDNIGHNTEKAIPFIVAGFLPPLAVTVDSLVSARRHGRSGVVSRGPTESDARERNR